MLRRSWGRNVWGEARTRAGRRQKRKSARFREGNRALFEEEAGDVVLSHRASPAVPSALRGLTTVFGMGTGVALSLNHQPMLGLQKNKQSEGGVLGPGSFRGVRYASFSGAWSLSLSSS